MDKIWLGENVQRRQASLEVVYTVYELLECAVDGLPLCLALLPVCCLAAVLDRKVHAPAPTFERGALLQPLLRAPGLSYMGSRAYREHSFPGESCAEVRLPG